MTRTIAGALASTLAVTAAAVIPVALSAPANADPTTLNGKYAIVGGADQVYVDATSNCATPVDGCTARLNSNRGWTSTATLTNGMWNFVVSKPDGVVCDDGSYAPVRIAYAVNAATLVGTITADSNGDCPGGQITQAAFQLQKVG